MRYRTTAFHTGENWDSDEMPEATRLHSSPRTVAHSLPSVPEAALPWSLKGVQLCFPPRVGHTQGPSGFWTYGDQPDPPLADAGGQVWPLPPQLQSSLGPACGGAAPQRHHLPCPERPGAWAGIHRSAHSREGQTQEQAGTGTGVHRWGGWALSSLQTFWWLWGWQTHQPGCLQMKISNGKTRDFLHSRIL